MYIHRSLLFAALMISWLARATCLSSSSDNLLAGQHTKSCSSDSTPVCGLRDKQLVLFSNACSFNAANENIRPGETIFTRIPLRSCMQGCTFSCPTTYKPVCVRNKNTLRKHLFRNQCELSKNICKTNTDYDKLTLYDCLPQVEPKIINKTLEKRDDASKKRSRPIPCTNVFKPVCGSYLGVKSSFKNECILNAENVAFNRDWRIVKYGMCPEDLSKTRRRKDKPANTHSIQKRSYDNALFNQYTAADSQLYANVDNKNKLNGSPNNVYVYIPPSFEDEFLNHDYQHSLTGNTVYDEYLGKFGTFTSFDMPFTQLEENTELNSQEAGIRPAPFSVNRMHLNHMANKNLAHEINQQKSFPSTKPMKAIDDELATSIENEYFDTSVQTAEMHEDTSMSSKSISKQKQISREKTIEFSNQCQFGSVAICAALADGTLRTFKTICEMMTTNIYAKKTWAKLHEGVCDDCKYNCSREYEPVCASRNGVNYTMVNECYFNMAICMDKKSKWKMLSSKECDRYTRIPDKYADSMPGFRYTSSYYVSETTEMTSTDSSQQATSSKQLKLKSSKNKRRKNDKREIDNSPDTDKCCSRSLLGKPGSEDTLKCKCWSDITQEPLSFAESQTESYIMSVNRE